MTTTVRVVPREGCRDQWDSFVEAREKTTFFHQLGWQRVLGKTFRYEFRMPAGLGTTTAELEALAARAYVRGLPVRHQDRFAWFLGGLARTRACEGGCRSHCGARAAFSAPSARAEIMAGATLG